MKRIEFDKYIKAKTATKAAEKFGKILTEKGYDWAAAEMIESVENGYFCCSNASAHSLIQGGRPTSPKSNDRAYYWAIENVDGNTWYAWFIELVTRRSALKSWKRNLRPCKTHTTKSKGGKKHEKAHF